MIQRIIRIIVGRVVDRNWMWQAATEETFTYQLGKGSLEPNKTRYRAEVVVWEHDVLNPQKNGRDV